MDATEGLKKAIADRKIAQAYSLKMLTEAVQKSRANHHRRMAEQRRSE